MTGGSATTHADGRTDQLRDFRAANDGQVEWDTEAPADFTYVFHPDRVLVRGADADAFERAVTQLDKGVLSEPPRRDDVRLLDGELVRYVLADRPGGESVPDILDLLEELGLPLGAASPDHWVHVAPGGGGGGTLCPAIEPEETGLTEPWPPQAPQHKKSCDVSVVVVDTGWNPPSGTDPRTPWLRRGHGRRRGQRPGPADVRRPRHVHRGRRALHGARDRRSSSRASPSAGSAPVVSSSRTSSDSSRRR